MPCSDAPETGKTALTLNTTGIEENKMASWLGIIPLSWRLPAFSTHLSFLSAFNIFLN
jgi:hypothetical protein